MIEFLLPAPPIKFAKNVMHWGTGVNLSGLTNPQKWMRGHRRGGTLKDSKSYTLGAYPRNVIGMKDLEIK